MGHGATWRTASEAVVAVAVVVAVAAVGPVSMI